MGHVAAQFERAALIAEYKDTKPPLPPPLNLACFAYSAVVNTVRRYKAAKSSEVRPTQVGFKKVPSNMDLNIFERREQLAASDCLRERSRRHEASASAKDEKLERMVAKLEEQNRARVEHVNARLDANTATLDLLSNHLLGSTIDKEEFILVHGEKYVHIDHAHKHVRGFQ